MMFIILGINDGRVEGVTDINGLKFDFKTGPSGVAIFIVGAIMATDGEVLKNDYNTVPIPGYYYSANNADHKKICRHTKGVKINLMILF